MAKSNGFGIASFVLGIAGLFIAGIPLGLLAIIFGAIGMNKNQRLSKAGFVLGVVDVVLGAIFAVLMAINFSGVVL